MCNSKENYLFIITPEQELSEFEKGIKRGFLCAGLEDVPTGIIKETAKELLELAKNEILRSDKWIIGNDALRLTYERGKAEALKDLPRWRKWGNGAGGNGQGIPIAIVKRGLNGYELVDALGIQGEQYIMLSDLEKLPKED